MNGMFKKSFFLGGCLALVFLAAACPKSAPSEIRVFCGSSMRGPVEELSRAFSSAHPQYKVVLDFGGSETLLPRILAGDRPDVFVCHDPFESKIREAGLWERTVVVGALRPVILVVRGNPLGIRGVADLAKRKLRLGIGDPRHSTCGEIFVKAMAEKGIESDMMKNVVVQGRTHGELGSGVLLGSLDAAVVWNFAARLYKEKADVVDSEKIGESVRVTLIGLKNGQPREPRDAWLDFFATENAVKLFAANGYDSLPPSR